MGLPQSCCKTGEEICKKVEPLPQQIVAPKNSTQQIESSNYQSTNNFQEFVNESHQQLEELASSNLESTKIANSNQEVDSQSSSLEGEFVRSSLPKNGAPKTTAQGMGQIQSRNRNFGEIEPSSQELFIEELTSGELSRQMEDNFGQIGNELQDYQETDDSRQEADEDPKSLRIQNDFSKYDWKKPSNEFLKQPLKVISDSIEAVVTDVIISKKMDELVDESFDSIEIGLNDLKRNSFKFLENYNAYNMFDEMPLRDFSISDSRIQQDHMLLGCRSRSLIFDLRIVGRSLSIGPSAGFVLGFTGDAVSILGNCYSYYTFTVFVGLNNPCSLVEVARQRLRWDPGKNLTILIVNGPTLRLLDPRFDKKFDFVLQEATGMAVFADVQLLEQVSDVFVGLLEDESRVFVHSINGIGSLNSIKIKGLVFDPGGNITTVGQFFTNVCEKKAQVVMASIKLQQEFTLEDVVLASLLKQLRDKLLSFVYSTNNNFTFLICC